MISQPYFDLDLLIRDLKIPSKCTVLNGLLQDITSQEVKLNLYESPIIVGGHMPDNDEERIERDLYKEELEKVWGRYDSLNELRKGHPNIMPLVKSIKRDNEEGISDHGLYHPQKELLIVPQGIFFKYGVIRRGADVPLYDETFKLANIEYILRDMKSPVD